MLVETFNFGSIAVWPATLRKLDFPKTNFQLIFMIALHVLNSPVDSFFTIYLSLPFNLNSQKRMFVKYVSYGKSSNLIDDFWMLLLKYLAFGVEGWFSVFYQLKQNLIQFLKTDFHRFQLITSTMSLHIFV